MSVSPTQISVLPYYHVVSLLRTEFNIGFIFSTSVTTNGKPNLNAFSKFLKKPSSENEVF